MRKKILLILLALFAVCICLAGCDDKVNFDGQAKVTFMLNGAKYKNGTEPVVHYYKLAEGQKTKILELNKKNTGAELVYEGFNFLGWYKDKNFSSNSKWNFATDTIDGNGITLYARWEAIVYHNYTYQICYIDEETQQKQVLGSYRSDAGLKFDQRSGEKIAAQRKGYTLIEFVDEQGGAWNSEFVHPGGDGDVAVDVYAKFIKGDYKIIRKASDFDTAIGHNIYLYNDIDMGGYELDLSFFKSGVFDGNGKKIYNFTVKYGATKDDMVQDVDGEITGNFSLNIGLFGLLNNAEIKNVTFDEMTIDLNASLNMIQKIFVAPISVHATDSKFSNVKVNCTYKYSRLPNTFYQDNDRNKPLKDGMFFPVTEQDQLCYKMTNSTVNNCFSTVTVE